MIAWFLALSPAVQRAIGYAGASIALLLALWGLKLAYDHEIIARHEAKQTAAVATASASANAASAAVIEHEQTKVEQSNAKARSAAAGSGDPLRAGFDSLRADRSPGAAPR